MTREDLCIEIVSMPWHVLQNEPDIFLLVQEHWDEGNKLFDLFFEKKRSEAFRSLINGPWSHKDLVEFKADLNYINKLA